LPSKTPRQGRARPATAAAAAVANARAAATTSYSFQQDPMTTAAQVDLPPPLAPVLGPVLGSLPDLVFQQEVLKRLRPRALASLAGAGRGCAAVVPATALMTWAQRAMSTTHPGHLPGLGSRYHLPPLCLKEACSHAAGGGGREVLEWLHNTGCPWNEETCRFAAQGGHLEVLQFAREHGCQWDTGTCAYAAWSGHLAVLQWAREHGCPWNYLTPANAAFGGHLEVL
jgi:hypothetical protein